MSPSGQNLIRRVMAGPGHVGSANQAMIFADLDLGFGLGYARDQGMKVAARLRLMIPVRMLVKRKVIAGGK